MPGVPPLQREWMEDLMGASKGCANGCRPSQGDYCGIGENCPPVVTAEDFDLEPLDDESPLKKLSNHFGITEEGDGKEWVAEDRKCTCQVSTSGVRGMHHSTECAIFAEPTKQRRGDQVLPTGDASLEDDQALLIRDIEARRQVGIERYGQGHRPFNGRDTLQDLYEEQLDLLVYLRSIKRMADASEDEIIEVIARELATNGFQHITAWAMAEQVYKRIQGWVAANIINATKEIAGA